MAKAVACALKNAGFKNGTIIARNERKGAALASLYDFDWKPEIERDNNPGLLINVTPIGMRGGPEAEDLAFTEATVHSASVVFDVVALPPGTPLIRLAEKMGKTSISGTEVMTLQAVEQFTLYTGQRPEPELVQRAAAFARQDNTPA